MLVAPTTGEAFNSITLAPGPIGSASTRLVRPFSPSRPGSGCGLAVMLRWLPGTESATRVSRRSRA